MKILHDLYLDWSLVILQELEDLDVNGEVQYTLII